MPGSSRRGLSPRTRPHFLTVDDCRGPLARLLLTAPLTVCQNDVSENLCTPFPSSGAYGEPCMTVTQCKLGNLCSKTRPLLPGPPRPSYRPPAHHFPPQGAAHLCRSSAPSRAASAPPPPTSFPSRNLLLGTSPHSIRSPGSTLSSDDPSRQALFSLKPHATQPWSPGKAFGPHRAP